MGSSFTIYNNTDEDIWVSQGTDWGVLGLATGITLAVVTGGASIAAVGAAGGAAGLGAAGGAAATAAAEGALVGGVTGAAAVATASAAAAAAAASFTVAGLTAAGWTIVGATTGTAAAVIGGTALFKRSEAHEAERKFKEEAERISPGAEFKFSGTLSLARKVTIWSNGFFAERRCWTGPTANSNHEYLATDV